MYATHVPVPQTYNSMSASPIGAKTNRDGIGARISVTANGLTQSDGVRSRGSYISHKDFRLHFGLGSANKVSALQVVWPSRIEEKFAGLPVNHLVGVQVSSRRCRWAGR